MCLAIPMKLLDRETLQGTAELDGVRRRIELSDISFHIIRRSTNVW